MKKLIILITVLFGIAAFGICYGLSKEEGVECRQWLSDSKLYANWFASDWQIQQCELHGITLPKHL